MKSTGYSRPRVGCCQRSSTSAPAHAAGREFDLRLKEQAQFVVFDRVAQLAQQRELVAGRGLERLFVDRERALLAPCAFQGQIRAAHQLIGGVGAVARPRARPQGRGDVDGLRLDEHRIGQRHDQRGCPRPADSRRPAAA